jgi:hypothetical protein
MRSLIWVTDPHLAGEQLGVKPVNCDQGPAQAGLRNPTLAHYVDESAVWTVEQQWNEDGRAAHERGAHIGERRRTSAPFQLRGVGSAQRMRPFDRLKFSSTGRVTPGYVKQPLRTVTGSRNTGLRPRMEPPSPRSQRARGTGRRFSEEHRRLRDTATDWNGLLSMTVAKRTAGRPGEGQLTDEPPPQWCRQDEAGTMSPTRPVLAVNASFPKPTLFSP